MSTALSIPRRTSLVEETVRVLRAAIQSGRWAEHLPGERRLCDEWHISRPTLRAALSILGGEGLLEVAHGRPTRVVAAPTGKGDPAVESGRLQIGLLSPEPIHAMPPFTLLWLDELRSLLAAEGHLLQVHVGGSGPGGKNPSRALAALVAGSPASTWVLYRSTESMQRWFEKQQIPCVIIGSPFDGVRLPFVDRDYRAVCRHAVGVLRGRGHQRLALVIQQPRYAGDRESEAGFEEGLQATSRSAVTGVVAHHDGTREGLITVLNRLLQASRGRPTGLIVARSSCALTACTAIQQQGLRIPKDVALICRDDDSYLDETVPSISRYSVTAATFARRLFRMVRHPESRREVRVMPEFLNRESC